MDSRSSETFFSVLWDRYRSHAATGPGIGRRTLLRSGAGVAAVSAVGMSGLLELIANRGAIAAGTVISILGLTREPFMDPDETPHRHGFSARFRVTDVSPAAIVGIISGRTSYVISTGSEP